MTQPVTRRTALKTFALTGLAALPGGPVEAGRNSHAAHGWVAGHLTGAQALVGFMRDFQQRHG